MNTVRTPVREQFPHAKLAQTGDGLPMGARNERRLSARTATLAAAAIVAFTCSYAIGHSSRSGTSTPFEQSQAPPTSALTTSIPLSLSAVAPIPSLVPRATPPPAPTQPAAASSRLGGSGGEGEREAEAAPPSAASAPRAPQPTAQPSSGAGHGSSGSSHSGALTFDSSG